MCDKQSISKASSSSGTYNDDNSNIKYEFSLPLHETLGWVLFDGFGSLSNLGEKLLSAYACHKYSMKRDDGLFYKTTSKLVHPSITTDKRLSNIVIIKFEAIFIPGNHRLVYEHSQETVKENEYRRFVDDNHPLLIRKLGGHGCNDLSNMRFHSREIHIAFGNYRLMINVVTNTFSIQYKKFIKKKECFLPITLTREILYTSDEGPEYIEPHFIVSNTAKTIIGVASFLECRSFSIKTIYAKYKDYICLYQRVQPDNFSSSYPFILECELAMDDRNDKDDEDKKQDILCKFFDIGCQLDATIDKRKTYSNNNNCSEDGTSAGFLLNHNLATSSKPLHKAIIPKKKGCIYFKKFDGIPATLIFFPHHFIIRNAIKSESFEHSLPREIYYILKDYKFLVESDLYVSKYKRKNENYFRARPDPLVIIDIQTNTFNANERITIIQLLKNRLAKHLYDYFIFFQGEKCNSFLVSEKIRPPRRIEKTIKNKKKKKNKEPLLLSKGTIYEVKLSLDNKRIITEVIKPRYDKYQANSCKMIDLIWYIQKQQTG